MEHFSNFWRSKWNIFPTFWRQDVHYKNVFIDVLQEKTQSFPIALNSVMLSIKTNHHGLLFSAGIDFDLYGTRRGTDAFDFYVIPFAFDAKVRLDLK